MKAPQQRQRYIAAGELALLVALAASIGSVDSTTSFRVCFGVLLLTLCVAQLKMAADLYKHRNNFLLQLFQPDSLSLFVTAGAIATIASIIFAFPEYDVTCALRQPNMGSVEILEGEGHYTCESRAGPYVLIVGIVLAAIPFGISLLINIESKGIPDKFRELDDIVASMASSFWMLLAMLPTVGMIRAGPF